MIRRAPSVLTVLYPNILSSLGMLGLQFPTSSKAILPLALLDADPGYFATLYLDPLKKQYYSTVVP